MEIQQLNIEDSLSYNFPLQRTTWSAEFLSWKDSETKVFIPSRVFNHSGGKGFHYFIHSWPSGKSFFDTKISNVGHKLFVIFATAAVNHYNFADCKTIHFVNSWYTCIIITT